jgi:plastocyanin
MNRKLLALALAAAALALGACGDDDEDSPTEARTTTQQETPPPEEAQSGGGADASQLKADADPSGQLKFTVDKLDATAGTVTIAMENPSDVPHAVGIKGSGVDEKGDTVGKGGTSTVTAELEAGEYEFYCPVPGHEDGGMKGTLSVK